MRRLTAPGRESFAVASVITLATGNQGGDRNHSLATTADVPRSVRT